MSSRGGGRGALPYAISGIALQPASLPALQPTALPPSAGPSVTLQPSALQPSAPVAHTLFLSTLALVR